MRLYALLCQEVGTRPEDRRLLRELSRSCSKRFEPGAPVPSSLPQTLSVALLAFAVLAAVARWLI